MKEFTVTGTLTLEGVRFYVKAETVAGALARLALDDYDNYDTDTAGYVVDSLLALSTIQENS